MCLRYPRRVGRSRVLEKEIFHLPASIGGFNDHELTTEALDAGKARTRAVHISCKGALQVPVPENGATVGDAADFCADNSASVKGQADCARRCAGEDTSDPRAINCPAFYYNSITQECILLQYFDATLVLAAKDGWVKYARQF